jgi:hypothetical protein
VTLVCLPGTKRRFVCGARQLQATTRTEAFGLADPMVSLWHSAVLIAGVKTSLLIGEKLTSGGSRREGRL